MQYRKLGKSGVKVSALGLGCMSMSPGLYSKPDVNQSINTLCKAIESGINFFDTADMYGNGHNEEFIGKILSPYRDQIIIGTKCGIVVGKENISRNTSKEYIKKSCELSLKRLGIDIIDLYYLHRLDPAVPIEESMEAIQALYYEGKIKYAGLSEVNSETIIRANAIFPVTAVQSEYSIFFRNAAELVLPTCKKLNIAFIPFSPISRGFLSGTIQSIEQLEKNDFRRRLPYFQDNNITHNLKLVDRIAQIAKHRKKTSVQISLAWLLAQDSMIIPIPGTSKVKHIEENIDAVSIELKQDEIEELNAVCSTILIKGARFPEELAGWFV